MCYIKDTIDIGDNPKHFLKTSCNLSRDSSCRTEQIRIRFRILGAPRCIPTLARLVLYLDNVCCPSLTDWDSGNGLEERSDM